MKAKIVILGANFNVYGGDISAFAGQSGQLEFRGAGTLDNTFFSPQPIPEPGMLGLFSVSALLLGWRARRKKP
jgi:hypothetical protein